MAAPANDLFSNARYLYAAGTLSDNVSGATVAATEVWPGVTTGTASIWYAWTALATTTVTIQISANTGAWFNLFYSPGTATVDTLSTIVLMTSNNLLTNDYTSQATVAVTQGVTYYIRVAGDSAATTFKLTTPPGLAPGVLRAPGTNDLPMNLTASVRTAPGIHLMEAVGYGPSSERMTSRIDLLADDEHSDSAFARNHQLLRNSDNSPSVSCERWVRVRFEPPFALIANLRFWVNNYQPNSGWSVYYGLAGDYRKPSTALSDIAVTPVPTSDVGVPNLGVDYFTGGQVQYSAWLVVQAVWIGGTPGPLQSVDLNFEVDWAEM